MPLRRSRAPCTTSLRSAVPRAAARRRGEDDLLICGCGLHGAKAVDDVVVDGTPREVTDALRDRYRGVGEGRQATGRPVEVRLPCA